MVKHFKKPTMMIRFDDREVTTPTLALSVLNGQREGNFPLRPNASLTAPIASGASTAETQVKKRMTPAPAPWSAFGRQLIPFELIVGYITDMKSPDRGSV